MSLKPEPGGIKKRTKLEKLLRQDHSDVYFDNDKLNDELNNKLDALTQEMYRHDIARTIEVHKLRREIQELRDNRAPSAHQQLKVIYDRPQTTGGVRGRKVTIQTGRSRSAWAETKESDTGSDHGLDEPDRPLSVCSSTSTLRDTITLRKYYSIGGNSFKERNRFPEEWYIRCLPASDAALYEARKVTRGKSAPAQFTFLSQLREKDVMNKKLKKMNRIQPNLLEPKDVGHEAMDNPDTGEKTTLICEQPVKPIIMSLRRYKAMNCKDNMADRAPSRSVLRKQNMKDLNAMATRRLDDRVRTFCRELTMLKERQLREEKEQEEARKREAQDQLYLLRSEVRAKPIAVGVPISSRLQRGASFRSFRDF